MPPPTACLSQRSCLMLQTGTPPEPDARPGLPRAGAPPAAHVFPLLDLLFFPFEPDIPKPVTAKGICGSTGSLTLA